MQRLTSVELFAGAGGLALGISLAGFEHVALVERDGYACKTLALNAKGKEAVRPWQIVEGDVTDVDYRALIERENVDLLAAGAPCQPFSLGGDHFGDTDDRNMFPAVFDSIRALRPRAIILENVYGLKRPGFAKYFEYILLQLAMPFVAPGEHEHWTDHRVRLLACNASSLHLGPRDTYHCHHRVMNSADYGTPQRRKRLIMVAFRRDTQVNWNFPDVQHSKARLLWDLYVSGDYWRRHDLLPRRVPNHLERSVARLARVQPSGLPWRTLRDAIHDLPEPIEGVPIDGLDFHVGIPNARLYRSHTGNDLDWPAKTIKAGSHGNPGGEHILHRDDASIRYMTVRECARVQDFPDTYRFHGTRTQAIRQIGNAVPVRLATSIATAARIALDDSVREASMRMPEQGATEMTHATPNASPPFHRPMTPIC